MSKPQPLPACENCLHVAQGEIDAGNIGAPRQLICRRFPPVSHPVNVGGQVAAMTLQPQVPPGGLCGEWESKN